jgi:hypothetical protein
MHLKYTYKYTYAYVQVSYDKILELSEVGEKQQEDLAAAATALASSTRLMLRILQVYYYC